MNIKSIVSLILGASLAAGSAHGAAAGPPSLEVFVNEFNPSELVLQKRLPNGLIDTSFGGQFGPGQSIIASPMPLKDVSKTFFRDNKRVIIANTTSGDQRGFEFDLRADGTIENLKVLDPRGVATVLDGLFGLPQELAKEISEWQL